MSTKSTAPEMTDACYFWLIAYVEATGGKVDTSILGSLLGKKPNATYMKLTRTRQKFADAGIPIPTVGTAVATGTAEDEEDAPVMTPKKKTQRKAAVESAKKRKAAFAENEGDVDESEERKMPEVKRIKLVMKDLPKEDVDDKEEDGVKEEAV